MLSHSDKHVTNFDSVDRPAIVLRDVTKTYRIKHSTSMKESFISMFKGKDSESRFNALENIDFQVSDGESVAVMGHNGSGKSTTLKLISGVQKPDKGWVRTRGRVGGLLEVGAGFHPDLTGRDNVFLNAAILGMTKKETEANFDEIVEFSGIATKFLDTEVKRYSSGMRSRLGFAVAVHTNIDVLLVDEVLSVGDAAFKAKCNDKILKMRTAGKTMFIVSHSTAAVQRLCDRGIVLNQGRIVFDGPISDAIETLKTASRPQTDISFVANAEISAFLADSSGRYGQPLGDSTPVKANGGGAFQLCEKGLVTSSNDLNHTHGIRNGIFQRAYMESGGPEGPWGFLTGSIRNLDDFGNKALRFQHGTALYGPDSPVRFVPE